MSGLLLGSFGTALHSTAAFGARRLFRALRCVALTVASSSSATEAQALKLLDTIGGCGADGKLFGGVGAASVQRGVATVACDPPANHFAQPVSGAAQDQTFRDVSKRPNSSYGLGPVFGVRALSRSAYRPNRPPPRNEPRPQYRYDDPRRARDLEQLLQIISNFVTDWGDSEEAALLVKAMELTVTLPAEEKSDSRGDFASSSSSSSSSSTRLIDSISSSQGRPDEDDIARTSAPLRQRLMRTLARTLVPLLPGNLTPSHCVVALRVCSLTGYGLGTTQDGDEPLPDMLLGQLQFKYGKPPDELLSASEQATLWLALGEAPELARSCPELLAAIVSRLLRLGPPDLSPRACSKLLRASARLLPLVQLPTSPDPLLHHLTSCMLATTQPAQPPTANIWDMHAQPSTANGRDLARAWRALGELVEDCGHAPREHTMLDLRAAVAELVACKEKPRRDPSYAGQDLADLLVGCFLLRESNQALLAKLVTVAGLTARRHKAAILAEAVWAVGGLLDAGCLDVSHPGVVQGVTWLALETTWRLRRRPQDFPMQAVAGLMRGYALVVHAVERSGQEVNISNVVGAGRALAALSHERGFEGLGPQELSLVALSMGHFGHRNQGAYATVVQAALQPEFYRRADVRTWRRLWEALAAARNQPVAELAAHAAAVMPKGRGKWASSSDCVSLLRALALLGVYDRDLVGAVLGRAVEQLRGGQVAAGEVCDAVNAVGVMGQEALNTHAWAVSELLLGLRAGLASWEGGERAEMGKPGSTGGEVGQGGGASGPGGGSEGREQEAEKQEEGGEEGGEGGRLLDEEQLVQLWWTQCELQAMEGAAGSSPSARALCTILRLEGREAGAGAGAGRRGPRAGRGGKGRGSEVLAAAEAAARRQPQPVASAMQVEVVAALERLRRRPQQGGQQTQAMQDRAPAGVGCPLPGRARINAVRAGQLVEGVWRWTEGEVVLEGGRRVAVLVDGAERFLDNKPHVPDGHTQQRHRQLRGVYGAGNVVCVGHAEWKHLGGDEGRQEGMLAARLWGGAAGGGGAEGAAGSG